MRGLGEIIVANRPALQAEPLPREERLATLLLDELQSQIEYGLDALEEAGFTQSEAEALVLRLRKLR